MDVPPTIPLAYATPHSSERHPRSRRTLIVLVATTFLIVLAAWVAVIFIDVETVLATGPLIGALGSTILGFALYARRLDATLVAIMHIALCLLLWQLTWLLHWGPSQAQGPFIFIGLGYLALALPVNLITFARLAGARAN